MCPPPSGRVREGGVGLGHSPQPKPQSARQPQAGDPPKPSDVPVLGPGQGCPGCPFSHPTGSPKFHPSTPQILSRAPPTPPTHTLFLGSWPWTPAHGPALHPVPRATMALLRHEPCRDSEVPPHLKETQSPGHGRGSLPGLLPLASVLGVPAILPRPSTPAAHCPLLRVHSVTPSP